MDKAYIRVVHKGLNHNMNPHQAEVSFIISPKIQSSKKKLWSNHRILVRCVLLCNHKLVTTINGIE